MDLTRHRPVIALDVDGVFNYAGAPHVHEYFVRAADQPTSPFMRRGGTRDDTLTLSVNPMAGRWINLMREHADVVWATTLEEMANRYLAPLLGIEPLPLACTIATHPRSLSTSGTGTVPHGKPQRCAPPSPAGLSCGLTTTVPGGPTSTPAQSRQVAAGPTGAPTALGLPRAGSPPPLPSSWCRTRRLA